MQQGLKNYGALDHGGVDFTWDTVQSGFQCCGVNNWTDWQNVTNRFLLAEAVPDSCCRKRSKGCGESPSGEIVYSQGCYDTFSRAFTENINYIGGKRSEISLTHW